MSKLLLAGFIGATVIAASSATWSIATHVMSRNPDTPSRTEIDQMIRNAVDRNNENVKAIVKETMTTNPDVMQKALAELIKSRMAGSAGAPQQAGRSQPALPTAPDHSGTIRENAATIFNSTHQVTLGNVEGDVTLVEFFDYNCGFCKRALADKINLIKADPRLRLVLKELPVLGPGSFEAAQVAVAVRMQDTDGSRYLAFHQKLLTASGQANKATAIAAAREVGFDAARIEQDLSSSEIKETLDESRRLASLLGINGTPSYVVGSQVIVGAIGQSALSDRIALARK